MNIIRKTLRLERKEYYTKHLLIINHILPVQMTPKEAEVLACFMSLEGDISKDPFGTTGRNIVKNKVGISAGGLGNYLDQLKKKNFILLDEDDQMYILPLLIPERLRQGYQFKLERNENN